MYLKYYNIIVLKVQGGDNMAVTLKAARVNAGLTQKEAAERIGVNVAMIVKWENEGASPTAKRILKILEVYGMKFEDIIFAPSNST